MLRHFTFFIIYGTIFNAKSVYKVSNLSKAINYTSYSHSVITLDL